MQIGIPTESVSGETRVAATPATTPITDPTGSGPFTLRREDWRAGDRVTPVAAAIPVPPATTFARP